MEPISLHLMDPNCNAVHERSYTVHIPRSVEQQLQQSKEILILMDIGIPKKTFPLNGLPYFHHLKFLT
jgi:hypothetical protein